MKLRSRRFKRREQIKPANVADIEAWPLKKLAFASSSLWVQP